MNKPNMLTLDADALAERVNELEARLKASEDRRNCQTTALKQVNTELEARLATANETIADLRDFAYNRAPKNAAEEANRQKAEFEARILAEHNLREEENAVHFAEMDELEAQIRDAGDYAEKLQIECSELEARAEAAEKAIKIHVELSEKFNGGLAAEIVRLQAEAGRLRATLEMVEWRASGAHLECLWCGGLKRYAGHKPDCARQAALHAEQDGNDNAA